MEEKDLRLFQMLMVNCRLTHRQLAERLSITVPAVHRRLQALTDQGIFTRFYANISLGYLGAVPTAVVGISKAKDLEEKIRQLVRKDYVEKVFLFGSNTAIITALLERLDGLASAVEHVRDTLDLQEFGVVMPRVVAAANAPIYRSYNGSKELSRLDYRIIAALHVDARRPIVDVAGELGVSTKTARGHLDRMIRTGAIEFGVDWKPERSSGISSMVRIEVRPEADKDDFVTRLNERFGPRVIITTTYHNYPDIVSANCWSPTVDSHSEMMRDIGAEDRVVDVDSRIAHRTCLFETWRERLLLERANG